MNDGGNVAIFDSLLWASGVICLRVYGQLLREAFNVIEED